jgi:hypothetical protein
VVKLALMAGSGMCIELTDIMTKATDTLIISKQFTYYLQRTFYADNRVALKLVVLFYEQKRER